MTQEELVQELMRRCHEAEVRATMWENKHNDQVKRTERFARGEDHWRRLAMFSDTGKKVHALQQRVYRQRIANRKSLEEIKRLRAIIVEGK